jgi:hypothetical protein
MYTTNADRTKATISGTERIFYVLITNALGDMRQVGHEPVGSWNNRPYLTRSEAWAAYSAAKANPETRYATICTPGSYVYQYVASSGAEFAPVARG